jgi:hypothetical protein
MGRALASEARAPLHVTLTGALVFCVLVVTLPRAAAARNHQWLIVPGVRVGPITATTGEDDLVLLFGRERVERRPILVGDGAPRPGTIVLGKTLDALEILWRDDAFQKPEQILIGGGKTRWKSREGITIGTSLAQLVKLNGRHFRFLGFGFDRGGTIVSWEGGRLGRVYRLGTNVSVRLGPDRLFDDLDAAERRRISGEQEISSATAILRKLRLTVWEIVILFR